MGKKRKHQKRRRAYTPLSKYQKNGSILKSPWKDKMPFQMWDWARDLLPEHLWIAAVIDRFGKEHAYKFCYKFMDAIDEAWPDADSVGLGLLTDFGTIPEPARKELWKRHEDLFIECFHEPIGRILTFYPENPAAWLVRNKLVERGGHVDPDVELGHLRHLVNELYPRRGEYATMVQALAFGRLLRHGKVQFGPKVESFIPLLKKYPIGCTQEEKSKVESLTRSLVSGLYMRYQRYKSRDWPRYFWRHNLDLAICRPVIFSLEGSKPMETQDALRLRDVLQRNAERARKYLEKLRVQVKCDLYDPERDEILFGLFGRLTRFYVLMMEDPNLWARDVAGILLRCLTDTAITFGYLIKCANTEEFTRFKKYGEGQEKLLLLHLQDSYPSDKSLEGRDTEEIGKELGWLTPELMDIELGHWTKKDTRKLAQAAGMEKYYRLVYTPTSSDLHGSWMSLKHSNLCHCDEPLHRFHHLPTYIEPPLFLETMVAAQQLFEQCLEIGIDKLDYPPLDVPLDTVIPEQPESGDDEKRGDSDRGRV
jgi:hypothetical protein